MKRTLIITLSDKPEDDAMTAEHVAGLVDQGYTCGYHPYWTIKEEDEKAEAEFNEEIHQALDDNCILGGKGYPSK